MQHTDYRDRRLVVLGHFATVQLVNNNSKYQYRRNGTLTNTHHEITDGKQVQIIKLTKKTSVTLKDVNIRQNLLFTTYVNIGE